MKHSSNKLSIFLKNKIIGLSISESEDLAKLGFSKSHLVDAKIEIARYLLSCGATLMYGGDLRNEGFTKILLELVESYKPLHMENTQISLINYLAWPLSNTLSNDIEAKYAHKVKFIKSDLPKDLKSIIHPENYVNPKTLEQHYVWARSLTFMREQMININDARIFIGGRTNKYMGKYPGIVEEVYYNLKANKPTYLIGAYGGATSDLITSLLGNKVSRFNEIYKNLTRSQNENIIYYNKNINDKNNIINFSDLEHFLNNSGIEGLNNGLDIKENNYLFKTKHIPEMISLILKGLSNIKL